MHGTRGGCIICIEMYDTEPADHCVTVRDRDTMQQVRIPIDSLKEYIEEKIAF